MHASFTEIAEKHLSRSMEVRRDLDQVPDYGVGIEKRNFSATSDPIELVVESLLLNVDQVVYLLAEACRGPQRYQVLGQSKACQLPLHFASG